MKRTRWSKALARSISQLMRRWLDRLFLDEDANAMAHGWEIQRLPRGGRRYRDPRWDSVRDNPEARITTPGEARTEVRR
jgi:hypothetical protein